MTRQPVVQLGFRPLFAGDRPDTQSPDVRLPVPSVSSSTSEDAADQLERSGTAKRERRRVLVCQICGSSFELPAWGPIAKRCTACLPRVERERRMAAIQRYEALGDRVRPCDSRTYRVVGKKREHRSVVAQVLGRPLPRGAVVHHVDDDAHNNAHENLVLCENQAYHNLLHRRQDALIACGHAGWLKCVVCKQYDDPEKMAVYEFSTTQLFRRAVHRECKREYDRAGKARRRANQ